MWLKGRSGIGIERDFRDVRIFRAVANKSLDQGTDVESRKGW